jgi:hypothetical protein
VSCVVLIIGIGFLAAGGFILGAPWWIPAALLATIAAASPWWRSRRPRCRLQDCDQPPVSGKNGGYCFLHAALVLGGL